MDWQEDNRGGDGMTKKIIQTIGGICAGLAIAVGTNMIHPGLTLIILGIAIMRLCEEVR